MLIVFCMVGTVKYAGNLFEHFLEDENAKRATAGEPAKSITVMGATSGDTGSAARAILSHRLTITLVLGFRLRLLESPSFLSPTSRFPRPTSHTSPPTSSLQRSMPSFPPLNTRVWFSSFRLFRAAFCSVASSNKSPFNPLKCLCFVAWGGVAFGFANGMWFLQAIQGLRGKKNIEVVILFPTGRVAEIQEVGADRAELFAFSDSLLAAAQVECPYPFHSEKCLRMPWQQAQMTTVLDKNINCVSVEGTFDDCQEMVKQCVDGCFRCLWVGFCTGVGCSCILFA
jgi:hypothetical protein